MSETNEQRYQQVGEHANLASWSCSCGSGNNSREVICYGCKRPARWRELGEPSRDSRAEALDALWAWCDERRNAPTITTLGMVQAKIEELRKESR